MYLYRPPILDRIVDSVKWKQERTERETQRKLGKGCKWRTMHHVTINQKNQKKGRQKEGNLPPRKIITQKVPPKEQEAKEIPKYLQKNRKQWISHVPPKEQEATKFPHVHVKTSIHSR
jgi:hypothetical protein